MNKPLACLLGLHRWQTKHNDEGQRYQQCERCKTERESLTLSDRPGG